MNILFYKYECNKFQVFMKRSKLKTDTMKESDLQRV